MANKAFDCVEMKRRGGRRVYERIRGMTRQEELAYWREQGARLDKRIEAAKRIATAAQDTHAD